MPPLRGKSTYPGCSDFRSHLYQNWEPILDRLIAWREREGVGFNLVLQVDTACHRLPGFIEKAARAGTKRVFIGLENINPDSLKGAQKGQNLIVEYRKMLQAWRAQKVMTTAGYILGFPGDTPETILRDIEIIKRELPIDFLEFFYLAPLPGSEDHRRLVDKGVAMDADLNKYDLNNTARATTPCRVPIGNAPISRPGTVTIRPSTRRR